MLNPRELFSLAAHVTGNGMPFYREFYGLSHEAPPLALQSLEEWHALPILTKDALAKKSVSERSHIPLSQIDHIRASSGTSGTPPLFSPRTDVRGMDYRRLFHDFSRPFMAFTVPLMPHWHEQFQSSHGGSSVVICHDPRHPRAAARLAKDAGVDAFSVFVYHVRDIGEEMKRLGINKDIRFIEITGEVCSRAQLEYIIATFPRATIVQSYNSSEIEDAHVGMPCRPLTLKEPAARYHPKQTHYLELIDPASGMVHEPRTGQEGDLLITAYPGEPSSFPLLRYRIGDTVRVVDDTCAEHGEWSFEVLGRTDMDFVKVPGGILRADEIARVLRLFPELVSDHFELHCSETSSGAPFFTPRLFIEVRDARVDLNTLSRDIAQKLRIAPQTSYADLVSLGRCSTLICEPLRGHGGGKAKRILWE